MKRALAGIAILAIIVTGGALLFRVLFPDDAKPFEAQDAGETPRAVDATTPRAEDAGAEDAGNRPTEAAVLDVRGVAQRRLASGRWADIRPGEKLNLDESVRTLSGGSVQLRLGDAVQVRLTARTEITIRELTERASRVRIEEGRIVADVNPEGRTVLRVEATGSDAMAEATGGSFSVISDGQGQVAVATTAGTIKLTSAGRSVEIGAGQTAHVVGDAAPSTPSAVPRALFLKVDAPRRRIQRERETVVEGKTQPGSLVRVGRRIARVSPDGSFRVKVPLREGKNDLAVRVTDVSGREKSHDIPPITVDTQEPEIEDPEVSWGED